MERMSYEEFKKAIVERIKEYLPAEYQNQKILVSKFSKNCMELDGLTIISPSANAAPTIYMNQFYDMYEDGKEMEDILEMIAKIRMENELEKNLDVGFLTDFEKVKDLIVPRIFGIEDNEKILEDRPHVFIEDLAVTFTVKLGGITPDADGAVPVTYNLMEIWGTDEEKLYNLAKVNQKVLEPSQFMNITVVLEESLVNQIMRETGMPHEIAEGIARQLIEDQLPSDESDIPMYVLTNKDKAFGASAILDEEMMDGIAEKIGKDFYILPSSLHEVIIVSGMNDITDKDELESMVHQVNATVINPMEKLSNSVYRYDYDKHMLVLAGRVLNTVA